MLLIVYLVRVIIDLIQLLLVLVYLDFSMKELPIAQLVIINVINVQIQLLIVNYVKEIDPELQDVLVLGVNLMMV